jgi:hypothetical protein
LDYDLKYLIRSNHSLAKDLARSNREIVKKNRSTSNRFAPRICHELFSIHYIPQSGHKVSHRC